MTSRVTGRMGPLPCLLALASAAGGLACGERPSARTPVDSGAPDSAAEVGAADRGQDLTPDAPDAGLDGGVGDGAGDGGPIRFLDSPRKELDLLFLIDDSPGMAALQAKFRLALPGFMSSLAALPGGLPDLHVAVVSSSLGAGRFTNIPGCSVNTPGNRNGSFQHPATCTGLHAGERFITSLGDGNGGRIQNFDGDLAGVLSCLTDLGEGGCGFEHQFESIRTALQRAGATSTDPDNGGFLRDNAHLAVVMVTNEDDCSAPAGSALFDPTVLTLADTALPPSPLAGRALGGLQSYRCSEFGHRCGPLGGTSMSPPHYPPATMVTLDNCVSAEDGVLVTVDGFVSFLESLKTSPDRVLLAALAGPTSPYTVVPHTFVLANGGSESQPQMAHSCMQTATEFADPAVRIKQALDAFGRNAVLDSICAPDLGAATLRTAQVIGRALTAQCLPSNIASKADGDPDCLVVQTSASASGALVTATLPYCLTGRSVVPCWELPRSPVCTGNTTGFSVCHDPTCAPGRAAPDARFVDVLCRYTP